jgi:hypothetical protein
MVVAKASRSDLLPAVLMVVKMDLSLVEMKVVKSVSGMVGLLAVLKAASKAASKACS